MASILLVEDDDQLRQLLKTLLDGAGYQISEASNGKRVCEMYRQQPCDLVITDLVMPDMEGLELITELRRIDRNVCIMAISGGGRGEGDGYLKAARQLGAQYILAKPFDNDRFLEAVRLVLENQTPGA